MTGPARCLLQLNSGGKATGARAESEGAAHVFDFPTRPRCVDVHVIVSDAVKGSHIQRSPLSMGGLCELGAVACSRHKKNIAELIMRKNAPLRKRSCATLGASLPMTGLREIRDLEGTHRFCHFLLSKLVCNGHLLNVSIPKSEKIQVRFYR